MPLYYNAVARHTPFHTAFSRLFPKSQFRIIPYRTFVTQIFDPANEAEMGKDKVNLQLKTPKGTKDCKKIFQSRDLL